jgi:polysaccharide biosynthesis/export protein
VKGNKYKGLTGMHTSQIGLTCPCDIDYNSTVQQNEGSELTPRKINFFSTILVGNWRLPRIASLFVAGVTLFTVIGCQTSISPLPQQSMDSPESLNLREGDVVKISFPGTPSLDTTQQIRRDGKITLSLTGEVQAAGYTPAQLEKKISDLCASQLVSKEVSVSVVSSTYPVYVSGAVLHPGKVTTDRPITVLQAIMEAGGFNDSANLKAVLVVRQEGGKARNYTVNVKAQLTGKGSDTFYLKPSDSVYVPENWY